jgi:deoxyribonuclease-4
LGGFLSFEIYYRVSARIKRVFTTSIYYDIMIKLGFHLSTAGSIANAPRYAAAKGYGDFQIFTSNPRAWTNSEVPEKDRLEFIRLNKGYKLTPFAHMPYLCNIASANTEVYKKSRAMLVNNLRNCMKLEIEYLVIHLGSHLGKGVEYGISNICDAIRSALDATEGVTILLENSSGYKNSVGSKFSEIGSIIEDLGSGRVGVCFDTCHAFAAGYDLRTEQSVAAVEKEFASLIGARNLKLVHLNDAKFGLGCGRDRHWHIGQGYIGRKGFVNLFRSSLFGHGFFVLETPGSRIGGDEDINLRAAKDIIRAATGERL